MCPSSRPTTNRSSSARTRPAACGRSSRIYSTALGPALGGTRFYPYASEDEALADVLDLSRGDVVQERLAGLDLGGGKAVIIGDPRPTRPRRCCAPTAGSSSRSAGATSPPATSARTSPTWTSSPGRPASSPAARRARRRRRLVGADRLRRLPGHAGRRGAPAGARPTLAGRRVGVAGVGKVGPHLDRPPGRRRRRRSWSPTSRRPRSRRSAATHPEVDVGRGHRRAGRAPTSTSTRPARSAARSTTRPCPVLRAADRLRRREQPARPPRGREAAGRPRHPLRARLRGQRRRRHPGRGRAPRLLLRAGQGAGHRHLRHHPADLRGCADAEGVPPAVAADRLAEQRMAEVGRLRDDPAAVGDRVPRGRRPPIGRRHAERRRRTPVTRAWCEPARGHVPYEPREMPDVVGARLVQAAPQFRARGSSHGARPSEGQADKVARELKYSSPNTDLDCPAAGAGCRAVHTPTVPPRTTRRTTARRTTTDDDWTAVPPLSRRGPAGDVSPGRRGVIRSRPTRSVRVRADQSGAARPPVRTSPATQAGTPALGEQPRPRRPPSGATTAIMPTPQLNVRSISACSTAAHARDQARRPAAAPRWRGRPPRRARGAAPGPGCRPARRR